VDLGSGDVVVVELPDAAGRLSTIAGNPFDLAVGFMTEDQRVAAVRFGVGMRKKGMSVDIALSPEKPKRFFARVGKGGFKQAAYIGPDDFVRGAVRAKDLATRVETDLPIA
jgi:histidyl-tRNA synthetase